MTSPAAFDPTRAAELFRKHAYRVQISLDREYPGTDPDMVADAVLDAVINQAADPVEDNTRLYQIARNNLRTAFKSDTRRRHREKKVGVSVTESPSADLTVLEELADREVARLARDRIARTDQELMVLDLWLNGYIHPAELAERVNLPEGLVRTVLDRIRKRIERERRRNWEGR